MASKQRVTGDHPKPSDIQELRDKAGRLVITLLAHALLVACGGQAGPSGPEPTVAWDSSGLHVSDVYGPARVVQEAPAIDGSKWQLQTGPLGALKVHREGDRAIATVEADLTGYDTIIVHRDGELLVPGSARVDVDGQTVATVCVLDCVVDGG